MLIKYINNGREDHVENGLGRSLINAGLAEEVEVPKEKPVYKPEPEWEVAYFGLDRKYVAIVLHFGPVGNPQNSGRGQIVYTGHPQLVNAVHSWDGGGRYLSGFGRLCPDSIVEEYARIWNENPNLRTVSAMALSINNARGDDAFRNRVHKVKGGPDIALPTNEQQATELAARGKK